MQGPNAILPLAEKRKKRIRRVEKHFINIQSLNFEIEAQLSEFG